MREERTAQRKRKAAFPGTFGRGMRPFFREAEHEKGRRQAGKARLEALCHPAALLALAVEGTGVQFQDGPAAVGFKEAGTGGG